MIPMTAWTRNTPWRQGHLLPRDALAIVPECTGKEDALVIVVSHDCDIAADPILEPTIEVVIGKRLETSDGNCLHAKNARRLHLRFDGTSPLCAEFLAKDKLRLSKEVFANISPDTMHSLSLSNKRTLECWLADRYRRSAFPNAFEQRLKAAKLDKAVADAVRPHGSCILKVLFDLREDGEIDPETDYTLGIILLYASEPNEREAALAVETAKDKIEKSFAKCCDIGVLLDYVEAVSDNGLTYQQFSMLKPWRLDHMSLGGNPQQPGP